MGMDDIASVEQIRRLTGLGDGAGAAQLAPLVAAHARKMGTRPFLDQAAATLIEGLDIAGLVPGVYGAYQGLVRDGLLLFLSHLPVARMVSIVAAQLALGDKADAGRRMVALASQVPTLHKLGQIIARNRHVDGTVRRWLVCLESGGFGTDAKAVRRMIRAAVGKQDVHIAPDILAEASVGAVVAFSRPATSDAPAHRGVFKVVKPLVADHIAEEMVALDAVARHLQENRSRYDLDLAACTALFADVKSLLQEELDLSGEKAHLEMAHALYDGWDAVTVPRPLFVATDRVLAMTFAPGRKVTDGLTRTADRKAAARLLFDALICAPLFSRQEMPVFHGDPHAGNILCDRSAPGGALRLALIDWSQAGRLSRALRVDLLKLVQGVFCNDTRMICLAAQGLMCRTAAGPSANTIRAAVTRLSAAPQFQSAAMMKRTFLLLERLSAVGGRFPRELLLFRKSFFILDGLLWELAPDFDMDHTAMAHLRGLLLRELPGRVGAWMMALEDRPERYRSLLSNRDVQEILLKLALTFVHRRMDLAIGILDAHAGVLRRLLGVPRGCFSRAVTLGLGLYYLVRMPDAAPSSG